MAASGLLTRGLGLGQPAARLLTRGLGSATADVILPPDLLAAVEARFHAGLGADFGEVDPLWRPKVRRDRAEEGDAVPYLVEWLAGGSLIWSSDRTQIHARTLRLRVYAETATAAWTLAERVRDVFDDQLIEWQGGYAIPLWDQRQDTGRDPRMGPEARWRYWHEVAFMARCVIRPGN